ncbi:MAG: serine acetyltransferase [Candidatus Electrothrix sp. AR4]|nr:serine acetyltransferase [Candidatus Electrothrix sp. AR4]
MSKALLFIYKIIYLLYLLRLPIIPDILNKLFIRILFGCHIGLGAKIGPKTSLGYGGIGVVIHTRAVIGENVIISTGVTIGGTSKKYEVPIIGDNTIIATGAKILGPVVVGKNCVIGANSVVLNNIPENCVAVGIPAKVIKREINIFDYR